MKTALITSTGSVAADISIKSLRRMGFRIIGCNIYPKEWIVESCEVDSFYQISPVADADQYLNDIKEICLCEKIDFLLPMIDYEIDLLNTHRNWFEVNKIVLCMSPQKSLDIIRDKKKLADFITAKCYDTQSIPTLMLKDVGKIEWDFPIVCKPFNGRSSQGLKYIHDNQEWLDFLNLANKDRYIVQPYIEGPRIVVEIVRQKNPHKVVAMTRRELISTQHGCSLTVLVYQDTRLEESAKKLADALDIIGDVNFEYILDQNGKYHFIECNPRFSAGCEFSCIGGYDCVENHIKCFMGMEIEDYHFKHNMIIARKYEEYITAVGVDVPYKNTLN